MQRTAVRFICEIVTVLRDRQIAKLDTSSSIAPISYCFNVIPAKAGTHGRLTQHNGSWVPACAGMTVCGVGSDD
jgi:hypothetical protein